MHFKLQKIACTFFGVRLESHLLVGQPESASRPEVVIMVNVGRRQFFIADMVYLNGSVSCTT